MAVLQRAKPAGVAGNKARQPSRDVPVLLDRDDNAV